jgi:hypothetical protein
MGPQVYFPSVAPTGGNIPYHRSNVIDYYKRNWHSAHCPVKDHNDAANATDTQIDSPRGGVIRIQPPNLYAFAETPQVIFKLSTDAWR